MSPILRTLRRPRPTPSTGMSDFDCVARYLHAVWDQMFTPVNQLHIININYLQLTKNITFSVNLKDPVTLHKMI